MSSRVEFDRDSVRVFVALVVAATLACGPSTSKEPKEGGADASQTKPAAAPARGPNGEAIVHVDKDDQEHMGLAVASAEPHAMTPELVAYGRIEADPATSFTVRAPLAGTIVADASAAAWPAIGAVVAGGDVALGAIRPRLTAVERADVAARLAAARGELASSRAALTAANAALERMRALNAEDKNVSDRALQEAEAKVSAEQARGAAAAASIDALSGLLEPGAEARASIPIVLGRAGTVVEVLAHIGEVVDAGAPLLRVESFDRLRARVDMPLDGVDHTAVPIVRIAAVGREDRTFEARRIAVAPDVDASGPDGAVLYALDRTTQEASGPPLRPGQAIVAWIARSQEVQHGFVIARSAIVRFGGKAWVYDKTGDEDFMRREVVLDAPIEQGWFATAPWLGGAHVVTAGAGALLSAEILGAQNKAADEDRISGG
jgi:biotin carboxyl carrier protein